MIHDIHDFHGRMPRSGPQQKANNRLLDTGEAHPTPMPDPTFIGKVRRRRNACKAKTFFFDCVLYADEIMPPPSPGSPIADPGRPSGNILGFVQCIFPTLISVCVFCASIFRFFWFFLHFWAKLIPLTVFWTVWRHFYGFAH
jgi:hypothetical protein